MAHAPGGLRTLQPLARQDRHRSTAHGPVPTAEVSPCSPTAPTSLRHPVGKTAGRGAPGRPVPRDSGHGDHAACPARTDDRIGRHLDGPHEGGRCRNGAGPDRSADGLCGQHADAHCRSDGAADPQLADLLTAAQHDRNADGRRLDGDGQCRSDEGHDHLSGAPRGHPVGGRRRAADDRCRNGEAGDHLTGDRHDRNSVDHRPGVVDRCRSAEDLCRSSDGRHDPVADDHCRTDSGRDPRRVDHMNELADHPGTERNVGVEQRHRRAEEPGYLRRHRLATSLALQRGVPGVGRRRNGSLPLNAGRLPNNLRSDEPRCSRRRRRRRSDGSAPPRSPVDEGHLHNCRHPTTRFPGWPPRCNRQPLVRVDRRHLRSGAGRHCVRDLRLQWGVRRVNQDAAGENRNEALWTTLR